MKKLSVLIVMVFLIGYSGLCLAGESEPKAPNPNEATTVKSGKSNSSDRVGAGGDKKDVGGAPDQKTTVKSSKSNSSE